VHGPRAQGHVLVDLGLLERAGRLGATADAAGRAAIVAAVDRLAGEDGMGRLFQAMAVTSGFDVPGFAAAPPL
jgi:SAM-dependent MidA family methyltransferase